MKVRAVNVVVPYFTLSNLVFSFVLQVHSLSLIKNQYTRSKEKIKLVKDTIEP